MGIKEEGNTNRWIIKPVTASFIFRYPCWVSEYQGLCGFVESKPSGFSCHFISTPTLVKVHFLDQNLLCTSRLYYVSPLALVLLRKSDSMPMEWPHLRLDVVGELPWPQERLCCSLAGQGRQGYQKINWWGGRLSLNKHARPRRWKGRSVTFRKSIHKTSEPLRLSFSKRTLQSIRNSIMCI